MISVRALFLADGKSDEPLGRHVATLARKHDVSLDVVAPDLRRLESPPGRRIVDRLACVLGFDNNFDVVIIHRDAESQAATSRITEIKADMAKIGLSWPLVPVVPIKMTEAWLLLDEQEIRAVAGRPSASLPLGLPAQREMESLANPKAALEAALDRASGFSGRRLVKFKRDFGEHRRQLLDRLDCDGPIRTLTAWKALEEDVRQAMSLLTTTH